ncbi:ABC transporter ATP-binding protein [Rhodobacteraceae bacterium D3-12]|nr:ABC transporter ATP-binding protein [Rhodobacteraceae bacterium D3-12]
MSGTLLEVSELTRSFYGLKAIDSASFTVEPGKITGLIGPNGAGKTTMFNCISGVIPAEAGRVTFDGEDVTKWRPEQISRRGLVRTFQIARGFKQLTVFESLLLHGVDQVGEGVFPALFNSRAAKAREEELAERAIAVAKRVKLDHVIDNMSGDLSGGQKKLLEIGRALMGAPKLILLDEPVAGVNPTLGVEIAERIKALVAEDGLTFLIVEHDMDIISRLCDHIVVMANGTDLMEGTFEEVISSHAVQDAYLGKRT